MPSTKCIYDKEFLLLIKSRDKEMILFINDASGPLHYSLHLHRTLCNNAGLLWSSREVLRRKLELL